MRALMRRVIEVAQLWLRLGHSGGGRGVLLVHHVLGIDHILGIDHLLCLVELPVRRLLGGAVAVIDARHGDGINAAGV